MPKDEDPVAGIAINHIGQSIWSTRPNGHPQMRVLLVLQLIVAETSGGIPSQAKYPRVRKQTFHKVMETVQISREMPKNQCFVQYFKFERE